MDVIHKLTLRHLRLNKGRTLATLLGIVLSAAMVCAVSGLLLSVWDATRRATVERTGDFHITMHDIPAGAAAQIGEDGMFDAWYTRENNVDEYFGHPTAEGHVNLYLSLSKPWRPFQAALAELTRSCGLEFSGYGVNPVLLGLDGAVTTGDGFSLVLIAIAVFVVGLLMTCTVVTVSNAFYISASERVRQFGLLKSAGATAKQIGRGVRFEALVLLALAVPLGMAAGVALEAAAVSVAGALTEGLTMRVVVSPWVFLATAGVALLTVWLSARKPARRAAKTPAMEAIRQPGAARLDVNAGDKELKTSRLTQKLFGFEGVLASKSLKRSSGKYRAAVAALTVSVVLFVVMSSVMAGVKMIATLVYGKMIDRNVNVGIYVYGSDIAFQDEVDAALRAIPGAELSMYRSISMRAEVPDGFYTEFWHADGSLFVFSLPDGEFQKIAPLTTASRGPAGLLLNAPGTVGINGVEYENVSAVNYTPGQVVSLMRDDDGSWDSDDAFAPDLTVAIAAEVMSIAGIYDEGYIHFGVVLPESVFRAVCAGQDVSASYNVNAGDPDMFCAAAEALFPQSWGSKVAISNFAAEERVALGIIRAVELFGYLFVLILSLIAVSSVVTTISTGMALRRREFAMLYSVGMTGAGMNKMLNLESALYAMKSLFIGLPLGVVLSGAAYAVMSLEFAQLTYRPPWAAMLAAAAAVTLISFTTMRYGKRKLKNVSIVEAIREETA